MEKIPDYLLSKEQDLVKKLELLKLEVERLSRLYPEESPVMTGQNETPRSQLDTSVKLVNCWEFKQCGREPGGSTVHDLGECPAAISFVHNGMNRGKNAGRYCWKIAGTMCDGKVQCTHAEKLQDCADCDFFKMVQEQEVTAFVQDWAG